MSQAIITTLLRQRHFAPYFYAQALGALNDNVLKNALAVLIALKSSQLWGLNQDQLINLSAALFVLPFFLVSAIAGQFADKYEKAFQIRLVKGFELFIMLLAASGWILDSLPILITSLCLMGLQSALFSPIKYAILPQALPREQLMAGNGLSEAGSFVAVLLGTGLGPSLMGLDLNDASWQATTWVALTCLAIAAIGFLISLAIPSYPPTAPDLKLNWNPFSEGWNMLKLAAKDRAILLAILALSWFWYFGATYLVQIPSFTINTLGLSPLATGVMMGLFIVGISLGSLTCHRLTAGRIETGLVAIGGVGMSVFGIDFYFSTPSSPLGEAVAVGVFIQQSSSWHLLFDMVMMGICGGFFAVPLYALIQDRSPPRQRARIMAANSMLNAFYMVVSALSAMIMLELGLSIRGILLITASANVVMLIVLLLWMPGMVASCAHQFLSRTLYRSLREDIRQLQQKLHQHQTDQADNEQASVPAAPMIIEGGRGAALLVSMVEFGLDNVHSAHSAPHSILGRLLPMVFGPQPTNEIRVKESQVHNKAKYNEANTEQSGEKRATDHLAHMPLPHIRWQPQHHAPDEAPDGSHDKTPTYRITARGLLPVIPVRSTHKNSEPVSLTGTG